VHGCPKFPCGKEECPGFGDSLYLAEGTGNFVSQPIDVEAAKKAGYLPETGTCDNAFGVSYTFGGEQKPETPKVLFFARSGELSGIGVDVYPPASSTHLDAGLKKYVQSFDNHYRIRLALKDSPCSEKPSTSKGLATKLALEGKYQLPLNVAQMKRSGWTLGSGFDTMGIHWAKDITTRAEGGMNWASNKLLPVVVMLHPTLGTPSAIFFTTPEVQQQLNGTTVTDARSWDGAVLPSQFMCFNWCDDTCAWDTPFWSTQHWYFQDPTTVVWDHSKDTCKVDVGPWKWACCPNATATSMAEDDDAAALAMADRALSQTRAELGATLRRKKYNPKCKTETEGGCYADKNCPGKCVRAYGDTWWSCGKCKWRSVSDT
jgi:hypothetical protein